MRLKAQLAPPLLALALVIASIIALSGALAGNASAQEVLAKPTGVSVADGTNPGEAVISWQNDTQTAYYRIGWVSIDDFRAITDSGNEWLDAFAFQDIKRPEHPTLRSSDCNQAQSTASSLVR